MACDLLDGVVRPTVLQHDVTDLDFSLKHTDHKVTVEQVVSVAAPYRCECNKNKYSYWHNTHIHDALMQNESLINLGPNFKALNTA